MFSALKKLMGFFFSHHNGVELSHSENDDSEISNLFSSLMNRHANFANNGENISIQRQKQLLLNNTIDDTTRTQYIKNIISYDTLEFENVTSMIRINPSQEDEFLHHLKKYGYNSSKPNLNFHCVYCHLVKVLLYHPKKPKKGQALREINGRNQYATEYLHLTKKFDKAINISLKDGRYKCLKQKIPPRSDEELSTTVNNALTLENFLTFVNSVDVGKTVLYTWLHEFQNDTGKDISLEKYYENLATELNKACYEGQDIAQIMLTWVVEDCYKLFLNPHEDEPTDDEIEESFDFDCESYRLNLEKHTNTLESDYSVGQKTWFARRKQQYDYYNKIKSEDKISILKEKNIRTVSYLKIYELMMNGVGFSSKTQRLSLEEYMTISFVGWIHDGKLEEEVRALF